ncbi:hypothetical protein Tco_0500082 [Tanacetum coccineum]
MANTMLQAMLKLKVRSFLNPCSWRKEILESLSEEQMLLKGHGSSLLICANILTGYTDISQNVISALSCMKCWQMVALFTCSVGCLRNCYHVGSCCNLLLLQCNDISAFASLMGYFHVLNTSYLLGFPALVASSFFASRFWTNVREILNPESSLGAAPWV